MTKEILRKETIHAQYDAACQKERACRLAAEANLEEWVVLAELHQMALAECVRLGAELMECE